MNEIKDRWNEIKEVIRQEYDLTAVSFNTWVAPLQFYQVENDIVSILIPAEQAHLLKYIHNKYYVCFKVTISELMEHEYDVTFVAETDIVDSKKPVRKIPQNQKNTTKSIMRAQI